MAASKKAVITPAARAAAVIVALGTDLSAEVYKHLREDEVEALSLEVAKLERLPSEEMQPIMEDFYGLCVTQKVLSEGGAIYAKDVLEKAFGTEKAALLMSKISQAIQTRAFDFVRKASAKNVLMMIQNEHPQTIAFILSYSTPEQASQVIAQLPKDLQINVVERIAKLDSVAPDIIHKVEAVMEKKFSSVVTTDSTEVGGINYVAEIMNHTDRSTEKHIFDELGRKDPTLSDQIRKLMFVFEDVAKLDDMTIQRVLREVDAQDLAIAIKGSNEDVKEILLHNMSKRAQENILNDIEYLRNIRMRDVEESQQRIVNVIRQLEESGEIVLSRGGEDEIIA